MSLWLTRDEIEDARNTIAGLVHHTPHLTSRSLRECTGLNVSLKAENLQKTGSFKIRGALNKVHHLSPAERARGIITASTGNHGQAVAYAGGQEGIPTWVVLPEKASRSKVAALEGYGAQPILRGELWDDANSYATELASQRGLTYVHPLQDRSVVAGQSTVGLEIIEDLPAVEAVLVPVGGGALASAVALAFHHWSPPVRIIGVEPEGAATMSTSRRAGRPVDLEGISTIADGLATRCTDPMLFEVVNTMVDDLVVVSDEAILKGMRFLLERAKLVAEPAGAMPVAALLEGKTSLPTGTNTVALISGGNFDVSAWLDSGD